MAKELQQEEFLNSSRTMLKNTDLIKRWFTHIHSVTDTQRIFLRSINDIALLADLMGHESIETTRIYLRRTASEQQELVDKIVTW